MPPTKSISVLPSTSWTSAPSARSTTTSVALPRPLGTAAARRASNALLFGPGMSVVRRIDGMGTSRPYGAGDVLVGVEHDEHAVIVADRILQIILQQTPKLEADMALHRQGRVVDPAVDQALVVLLGAHAVL